MRLFSTHSVYEAKPPPPVYEERKPNPRPDSICCLQDGQRERERGPVSQFRGKIFKVSQAAQAATALTFYHMKFNVV